MPISGRVPLMEPGQGKRNFAVALVGILLLPVVVSLAVAALPFYLLVAVGTNRNGLADRLADSRLGGLPGVNSGGWTAGIAVFGYTVLLLAVFGSVFGGGGGGEMATETPGIQGDAAPEATASTATEGSEADPSGSGADADTATDTEGDGESGVEQVAGDTYDEPGLATGVSNSGDTVLFGFADGNLMVYDETRDGGVVPLGIDRSVSHIEVVEDANTAAVAWMDAHAYAVLDLSENDGPAVRHPGLWDVDAAEDGLTVASVSSPTEGTGSVGLSTNGDVQWETRLQDAAAVSVAVTDDGRHVAVGASHYWTGDGERQGTPGVHLYDGDGTRRWTHETDEDVISVGVDADRGLVVAGTDDGRTIVFDFDGDVLWETDSFGGWVRLSGDGSTVVTSEADGALLAVDAETGDERWSADIGIWAARDVSVSEDGDRVLASETGGGAVFVVETGDVVWEENYNVGPAVGEISGDGSTWSVAVQNNDDQTARVEVYRDHSHDG